MGPNIDPVTGLPLGLAQQRREEEARGKEEAKLKDQAAFLSVLDSEAVKVLVDMVEKILFRRIESFLVEDAEAKVCTDILKAMGINANMAQKAVNTLTKRYFNPGTERPRKSTLGT